METLKVIEERRSIRKFKDKKISKDDLEKILKAAMFAPSAYDERAWQFVVIDDRKLLDKIPSFHSYASMCKTAPVAILICADLNLEQAKDMWIFDCAAATQNILLAAWDLKIGSCWVSAYFRKDREEGFKNLLNLLHHLIPVALVPLGYPDEEKPTDNRFDKSKIHYNSF